MDSAETPEKKQTSRKASQRSSIFGDATPREVVLERRTGKPEKEILAEEAMHEKLHLRLTPQQEAEKRRLEDFIAQLEWNLSLATDIPTREALSNELSRQRFQLQLLTDQFEREAIQRAKHSIVARSTERISRARSADYQEDPFLEDYEKQRQGHGRGRRRSIGHFEDYHPHEGRAPYPSDRQDYSKNHPGSGYHQQRYL